MEREGWLRTYLATDIDPRLLSQTSTYFKSRLVDHFSSFNVVLLRKITSMSLFYFTDISLLDSSFRKFEVNHKNERLGKRASKIFMHVLESIYFTFMCKQVLLDQINKKTIF